MKKPLTNKWKYFTALFLSLFILGGQPVEFGEEKILFHGYSIQKPIIRIGLGVNLSEIKISSSSGVKIYEAKTNYKLIADDADEVLIKGLKEKLNEKFVILVAQTENRKEAEIFVQDLKTKIEQKVYITENSEERITGTYQVKVGDFLSRDGALNFIKKLNDIGIRDTWILQEEIPEGDPKPLWILVNRELKSLNDDAVLYFIPSNLQSFLSFNGRNYRGIFVVKASPKGIVLINVLNIEDYLKAVVPSELSPYSFSELEAHKAQAIAARTYAIKNLDLNNDFGFDLCDTPKSQFYKGMNAEHPLSSLAVEQTRGQVALYNGELIDALYTSTCGGMTENVEEVFMGPALPYLRSTVCEYEKQNGWFLRSENRIHPIHIGGRNISSEIAYLQLLRIIPHETDPFYYKEQVTPEEVLRYLDNVFDLKDGIRGNLTTVPTSSFFLSLGHQIMNTYEWKNRVEQMLLQSDDGIVQDDSQGWYNPVGSDQNVIVQPKMVSSSRDLGRLNKMSRGELVSFLWKILKENKNIIHEGVFKGFDKEKMELEVDRNLKQLILSPDAFLLRNYDEDYSFASQIYVFGEERVRWIERDKEILLLEVVFPEEEKNLKRSAHQPWQVRKSREELERRINEYYPIGKLLYLVPLRKSDSGRVTELLITGSETQVEVSGLRIRWVLGLRETRFVLDRAYDEQGRITHFIFSGRGWGHGVGLCQIGAFGMAQAGSEYKQILKKFYQDITISKIY